jgi:hypothetical protein
MKAGPFEISGQDFLYDKPFSIDCPKLYKFTGYETCSICAALASSNNFFFLNFDLIRPCLTFQMRVNMEWAKREVHNT